MDYYDDEYVCMRRHMESGDMRKPEVTKDPVTYRMPLAELRRVMRIAESGNLLVTQDDGTDFLVVQVIP